MIKYENSILKIYIRNIKHYTDIDATVDFVFPVNKIDRSKGEKTNLKLTKCVFRSCNQRTKHFWDVFKVLAFSSPGGSTQHQHQTIKGTM